MPAERYYSDTSFSMGQAIALEDQEFHHLVHVMRGKVGHEVELVNGRGQLATAKIASLEKRRALIDVVSVEEKKAPSQRLILAQAIPRINRLETVLEKATELGATEIWLFASAHSERKAFTDHQIERLTAITVAAMKQCGRLHLPRLQIFNALEDMVELPKTAFFGEIATTPPPSLISCYKKEMGDVCIFIGPESGFTEEEATYLKDQGVKGVSLHPNILRTDTAAIAALSLLSHINI